MCRGMTLLGGRRVAVDVTLPAVLAGDVAIGAASPFGFAGSVSPDVILSAFAEGAPLGDCVGVASPTGVFLG